MWIARSRRSPTSYDLVVGDHEVVRREHLGVVGSDADVDAGVAHGGDGLDVVPVPVRGEHPAHTGGAAHLEQQLVLVGRVEQHGLAGLLRSHDEHVVLERPDDQLVDPDVGVLEVRRMGHAAKSTRRGATQERPGQSLSGSAVAAT